MTTPSLQPPFYYHRLANGLEMVGQHMPSLGSVAFAVSPFFGIGEIAQDRGFV
jgi:hypothetical protein